MKDQINIRESLRHYIKDKESRILELGPLERCLLDREKYPNYFFGDVKSTNEIKHLYSDNEYLKRTNIFVNTEDIIDIDFVIKESYKKTFKNIEKFDYVIVAHVLEHIPNLLNFFVDIQNILKKNGEIIIIYPDKRFCFDYFRENSNFSSIYDVYVNGGKNTAKQVLDFYTNVIPENDPRKFWDIKNEFRLDIEDKTDKNIKSYENSLAGKREEDIHYWPFSDVAFIKFLQESSLYGFLPFKIKKFIPTQINTHEFLVVLSYDNKTSPEKFYKYIAEAKEYFYYNYYGIYEYEHFFSILPVYLNKIYAYIEEKEAYNIELENQMVENSRIRNMAKNIVKKLANYLKMKVRSLLKIFTNKLRKEKG